MAKQHAAQKHQAYDAVIALGSNIGDKAANIAKAIDLLTGGQADVSLVERSRNYKTPPWGITEQDWFINACVSVKTGLVPLALLHHCLSIEEQMGRKRAKKWGPRTIDLDVLVYRDQVLDTPELQLPHPHITERAFVLVPMADVAPDHVIGGKTVAEWLAAIEHHEVTAIE